jgi:hypothetical protein
MSSSSDKDDMIDHYNCHRKRKDIQKKKKKNENVAGSIIGYAESWNPVKITKTRNQWTETCTINAR